MKFRVHILTLVLSALPVTVYAQCSSSDLKPVWDADKGQFRCVDPKHPGAAVKDDSIQATGDKESCASARDNLQAACPPSNEGKACKSQAKSIYNACNKRAKSDGNSPSLGSSSGAKTDSATCMATFQQQQQACNARKLPPTAPGQPVVQDTCLQDALAAQSRCLANSR